MWLGLRRFRGAIVLAGDSLTVATWLVAGGLLLSFTLALSLAINRSVEALFARGDLDLLVSSPLSSKVIFTSRALGIALTVALTLGLLVVPVASAGVMLGLPQLLGLYPALFSLALTAASFGMLLTLLLVKLFGARRARTISQIVGSFVGGLVVILSYLPTLAGWRPSPERLQGLAQYLAPGALLGPESPLWFPARAALLDPLPLLVSLGLSLLLFYVTVTVAHRGFIAGTQRSMTLRRRAPEKAKQVVFRGGLTRVMLFKEWRLIFRDPYLLSQTLLQVIYLIPLAFLLFSDALDVTGARLGVAVVALGGTLASSLARICVSGEEAPELLAAAPVPSGRLRGLKLLAALSPVWLLCLPIFMLLAFEGAAGWPVVLLSFFGATLSAGVLNLWNGATIPRADLFKSSGQKGRDPVLGVIETVVLIAWLAVGLGLPGAWWGWPGLLIGVAAPLFAYLRYQGQGSKLAY